MNAEYQRMKIITELYLADHYMVIPAELFLE